MREIKVRIWTGKEYRYSPPIGEWDFEDCEIFAEYRKDAKAIEQYTGLKDKNGREIYHNDIGEEVFGVYKWRILIAPLSNCPDGPLYGIEIGCNFRIDEETEKHIFEWSTENKGRRYELPFLNKSFEIIGNIHENPELLGHNPGPSAE